MDDSDDLSVIEDAVEGDAAAAEVLIRRYQVRMFNFARALMANDSDAEDVAQETFFRAFRGLRQFRGESSFKNWLYRIATNVALTHVSKRNRQAPVWERSVEADDMVNDKLIDEKETVEDLVIRRDLLDRSLSILTDDLRIVLVMHDIEGLEYREIAKVLKVPIGTVMSRIFRARKRLRPLLTDLLATPVADTQLRNSKRESPEAFGHPAFRKVTQ